MGIEYKEGPEAKENFDRAMKSLFQATKSLPKKRRQRNKPSTLRKPKRADKD